MVRVLIELIEQLLRMLFGQQEPPADVGPGSNRPKEPPRRGPYNYGDGAPPRTNRPAKTLAELLEEVRREEAIKRGQIPNPAAPKAIVATVDAPPPRPALPPVQSIPRPMSTGTAATQFAPGLPQLPQALPQTSSHAPTIESARATSQAAQVKRKKDKRKPGQAAPPPPRLQGTSASVTVKATPAPPRVLPPVAAALQVWTQSLRNNTNATQRQIAMGQALLASEILGPPRSKRALR